MNRDKDWIEGVRRRLRDVDFPPPEGGWERLQRELGEAQDMLPPVEGRSVWHIRVVRFAAAAAVFVGLAVGGGYLLRAPQSEIGPETLVCAPHVAGTDDRLDQLHEEMPVLSRLEDALRDDVTRAVGLLRDDETVETALAQRTDRPDAGETLLLAEAVTVAEPHCDQSKSDEGALPDRSVRTDSGQDTSSSAASSVRETPRSAGRESGKRSQPASSVMDWYDEPSDVGVKTRKRASFSLFAGGGVAGGAGGRLAPRMMYSSVQSDVSSVVGNASDLTALRSNNYSECSFRHHQSLSFGLTVSKEFAHGLSLESGVNYTLLRSDVRMKYSSQDASQRLHFIGLPLRLNWRFVKRGDFSLYIGAGGMVEKCVSAKIGSRKVNEPGLHWSAQAVLGAEYRLGDRVGLYFEPEGSYYFTETRLRTDRTRSPLTLNLRLGVRLLF